MPNRSATDTIIGYFYQFDKTILEILSSREDDRIFIEGIEDIDILNPSETVAIQCKYYSKTEYNHSVISKAIRFMAKNYKSRKDDDGELIKYKLYGHYKSGHEKLVLPLNIAFIKDKFFTYTEKKVSHELHNELNLIDDQIEEFIDLLEIDINANSYEDQKKDILDKLVEIFSCSIFEAEYYYYNNAISEIKNISTQDDEIRQEVSKQDFLEIIDKKKILFNKWFLELKGKRTFYQNIKREFFTLGLNTSPFERFFLIDLTDTSRSLAEIKYLLFVIQKKWSKLSQRERQPFCPYVFLYNFPNEHLIQIKKMFRDEDFLVKDGYDFEGANFSARTIQETPTHYNKIKLKIINHIDDFNEIFIASSNTREVYEFYKNNTFIEIDTTGVRHIKIQFDDVYDILEVIK